MSSAMVSAAAAQGRLFLSTADVNPADANPEARSLPDHREHTGTLGRFFQSKFNNQKSTILAAVTSASHLAVRPAPEMLSSGIAAINALTGGWPRGCLTEICGPASSGRTTVLLAALAAATRGGEFCVLVDASDALDPRSAADAGVDLDRLLWIRCGDHRPPSPQPSHSKSGCPISRAPFAREACPELVERVGIFSQRAFQDRPGLKETGLKKTGLKETGLKKTGLKETGLKKTRWKENSFKETGSRHADHRLEQVLHATDLLLESGGFGLVVLDLSDLPSQQARRIPLTTWFRFRRAVENTSTVLLAIEQQLIAGSCSSLQLRLEVLSSQFSVPSSKKNLLDQVVDCQRTVTQDLKPSHTYLLTRLEINAELILSRFDRKPASSVMFEAKTAWAG
jgi:recombination protein RecA